MAADENGDGVVTRDEFEVFLLFTVYFNNLWQAFSKEGKHVSSLDRSEFADLWSSLGTPGHASDVFDAMDDDGNYYVSYSEFCTFLARRTCKWDFVEPRPNELETAAPDSGSSPLMESHSLNARAEDESVEVTPTSDGVEIAITCERATSSEAKATETPSPAVARQLWRSEDSIDVRASEEGVEASLSPEREPNEIVFIDEEKPTETGHARWKDDEPQTPLGRPPSSENVAEAIAKEDVVWTPSPRPPPVSEVDVKMGSAGTSSRTSTISPDNDQAKSLVVIPYFMMAYMPLEQRALIVFDEYDRYGRKALSFDKMNKIWKILFRKLKHKIPVRKAFDAADLDGNGTVSRRQLEIFCRCTIYYNNGWDRFVISKKKSSPWKSLTKKEGKLVTKHTKRLSRADFRIVAPVFGVTEDHVDHVFNLADDNGSEQLNFDEFCFWLARNTCDWKMR